MLSDLILTKSCGERLFTRGRTELEGKEGTLRVTQPACSALGPKPRPWALGESTQSHRTETYTQNGATNTQTAGTLPESPEDTHGQASSHTWSQFISLVAQDSIF